MMDFLAVALGKSLRFLLRRFRRGGGSALPGLFVAKLAPGLLERKIGKLPRGLIVVSGSAGKSSTTLLLVRLLEAHGLRVFSNPSTANIRQGYFSAILSDSNWRGQLSHDIAVLEVDEGHGATLVDSLSPNIAVLTNVLSDQLDRFVDPRFVIEKLHRIGQQAKQVILNGDDRNLNQLKFDREPISVGLSDALLQAKDAPKYAFNFGPDIATNKVAVVSKATGFRIEFQGHTLTTAATTAQHALNDALALVAASAVVDLNFERVQAELARTDRVFARDEIAVIRDRKVNLRLVQNPTSFQLNLDQLKGTESPLMLMAGSDIHDPSWLWTVDFSKLDRVDVVGGSNASELALRLSVSGAQIGAVIPDPAEASEAFLAIGGDRPTILFSADAMRRTRRYLGLAK